jgi:hypothetical protein
MRAPPGPRRGGAGARTPATDPNLGLTSRANATSTMVMDPHSAVERGRCCRCGVLTVLDGGYCTGHVPVTEEFGWALLEAVLA